MAHKRIWILGAQDPEMEAIEKLLTECGETVIHALDERGQRVHPGNAYTPCVRSGWELGEMLRIRESAEHCDPRWTGPDGCSPRVQAEGTDYAFADCEIITVECEAPRLPPEIMGVGGFAGPIIRCTTVDHHRPGDPGFGRPPAEFLEASSLGQVISKLADLGTTPPEWEMIEDPRGSTQHMRDVIPSRLVMIAAADHCLGAAYAGKCPGVAPEALGRFRAEERARFSGRDVSYLSADIESTTGAIKSASKVQLAVNRCCYCGDIEQGCAWCSCGGYCHDLSVADMRREPPWPELPEAGTRAGVSYIAGPLDCPDGRRKITCSGTPEVIEAFMRHWGPAQGLTDIYGDPARGFAGGYV